MSGCPAAMMPAPAPLPSQDAAAPHTVGPTEGGADAGAGWHPAPRGRGLTSQEAVEAAEQVLYVCMYACMYVYVCMHVCMYVCMTKSEFVCVCIVFSP